MLRVWFVQRSNIILCYILFSCLFVFFFFFEKKNLLLSCQNEFGYLEVARVFVTACAGEVRGRYDSHSNRENLKEKTNSSSP